MKVINVVIGSKEQTIDLGTLEREEQIDGTSKVDVFFNIR